MIQIVEKGCYNPSPSWLAARLCPAASVRVRLLWLLGVLLAGPLVLFMLLVAGIASALLNAMGMPLPWASGSAGS